VIREIKDYLLLKRSRLFDAEYYLANYPDIRSADVDPLWHFVTVGWKEQRNPSNRFYTRLYMESHPEAAAGGINPLVLHAQSIQRTLKTLKLNTCASPQVSIIIPVYNHVDETIRCLAAIAMTNEKTSYEVIITDDGSTDSTRRLLARNPSLRYLRNDSPLGFLQNCNRAAEAAAGDYLVLLNNDTEVTEGWLDNLLQTFRDFPTAGLVGSMLLYPDGRLQEAGGVIWRDASGMNFGRFDDPERPEYNYARDVDYCSAASVMLPRRLWQQLGGFDEHFLPAYYEDTDLAFRIRQAGHRVMFQPLSRVLHVEGATCGVDLSGGVKRYQLINQEKFREKWAAVLKDHGQPDEIDHQDPLKRHTKLNILFIDAITPRPDSDSGSIDAFQMMKTLRRMGHAVTFIPRHLVHDGKYTRALQQIGVECLYPPFLFSIQEYLKREGQKLDLVILSHFPVALELMEQVRSLARNAKIAFNTVDLHFLRLQRQAELDQNEGGKANVEKVRAQEMQLIRDADCTILVSQFEQYFLEEIEPGLRTKVLTLPREIPGRQTGFNDRKDVVFIGGFGHLPNIDAVGYFVDQIWPLAGAEMPGVKFLIAGSNMPESIKNLESATIKPIGFIEDLDRLFNQCRVSVAPLRFGAGIKGKIVTSLSYGVPCVATSVAAEGMNLVHGENVLISATPGEFAQNLVKLYQDRATWESLSDQGLDYVRQHYSLEVYQQQLTELLAVLGLE
jgi:GT2 family glycosyltransferase/glycosyltransferase involved in cell wall biosynthesis